LVNLYQVGGESGTKTTTALNFVVSQEFNLSINDITLSNPNVSKDSLSYDAQGTTYSLAISGSEN
jgi:hypothetical protein